MKLFCTIVFINLFPALSQEDQFADKFSYRSVSLSPIGFYSGNSSGVSFAGDVSFECGANLQYGSEFPFSPKFVWEVYGGAGLFHFQKYGMISS